MPIDLNEVLKNPATLSVLGAIGAFVLSTFLAPRLGEIIKSFAAFIFLNIKHFISFALLTIIFHFILKIPVLINIPLTVTIITLISLSIEFKSFSKKPTLLYFGSYHDNDNSYLNKNIKTEKIDSMVEQEIEFFERNSYLVKMGFIRIESIQVPRFFTLINSYKSLNKILRKLITNNRVFGFSFIIESESILYKSYLNINKSSNSTVFNENIEVIQGVLDSSNISQNVKFNLTLKINFMTLSQSFNDLFIDVNDISSLKHSLEDNFKLISTVKNDIEKNNISSIKAVEFVNFLETSYYRYYAILMFKQKNYEIGIKKIFDCIKLNAYFPYDNYNDFKRHFATRYYVEILPLLLNEENQDSDFYVEVMSTHDILLSRLEDNVILFNIDIFKDFIEIKDLSEVHIELIEIKLEELDDNVANLLFKSEVLKFLPQGTERIMNIYVDRIEACIIALQRIIEIDPSFPLIHQKIGFLKLMYSLSKDDESLVQEATHSLKIGFDEIRNLGVSLVNDSEDLNYEIDEASASWLHNNTAHD